MKKAFKLLLISIGLLIFLNSCHNSQREVSFYYWKTNFSLSGKEQQALQHFNTKQLYLRFFDVDKKTDPIIPLGVLQNITKIPENIAIIPVVYITNRSFRKISDTKTKELALHVFQKIKSLALTNHIIYNSIQIDCDWSDATKEAYFMFLRELKNISKGKLYISATIRLHQIKYAYKTGIPPVDQCVLMFYNMGKLSNLDSLNSIYNTEDAEKYIAGIKDYPLKMNVALPVFSWIAQYRNGKIIKLLAKQNDIDFNDTSVIEPIADLHSYKIKQSFLRGGIYYKKGDELKPEKVQPGDLLEAAKLLSANMPDKDYQIIFFDLDEYNINFYTYENIDKVVAALN
jgi:hypothetical protein